MDGPQLTHGGYAKLDFCPKCGLTQYKNVGGPRYQRRFFNVFLSFFG